MVVKYIGFPSALTGKRVHEIFACLRDAGRGRVIYRNSEKKSVEEPTFWFITKSNLDRSFKDGKGSSFHGVFVNEGVNKGEMEIPRSQWVLPDWRLADTAKSESLISRFVSCKTEKNSEKYKKEEADDDNENQSQFVLPPVLNLLALNKTEN